MQTGEKIKKRRFELRYSVQYLADLIGKNRATVYRYENNEIQNFPLDVIEPIAKALNVSTGYLTGWDEYDSNIEFIDLSDTVSIPVVVKIPASVPIEAIKDVIEHINIPKKWTNNGKQYIGLKVTGDSMYPIFLDGDTVIIQLQQIAETGDICDCYVNGYDVILKRIILTEKSITLKPENPNYSPNTYTHPGEVKILGKVVQV